MVDARIIEAVALTKEMDAERKKYEMLRDLAYKNEVEVVKSVLDYSDLTFFVPGAQEELKKNAGERFGLSRLQRDIQDHITGEPVEIVSIASCGYETYGWSIEFTCRDVRYDLVVPNIPNVTEHNYQDSNCCRLFLGYYKTKCYVDYIKTSYDVKEVAEAFAAFIKEER